MAVLVDTPMWPRHGRLWAHLVSDTSLDELHAFAARAGIPARGFDHDHYDVPDSLHAELITLGAHPVSPHELIRRLRASGLRVTRRDRACVQRSLRPSSSEPVGRSAMTTTSTPAAATVDDWQT